jgi:hypothetical protein
MTGFWEAIDAQLAELKSAQGADDVIRILGTSDAQDGAAQAFFAGSGGDGTVRESLYAAGWTNVWIEASYYWAMRAPDGSVVTYVEGDIYRGSRR